MLLKLENLRVNALRFAYASDLADRNLHAVLAEHLGVAPAQVRDYRIAAKSVDARRGAPELIYTVFAELADEARPRPGAGEPVTPEAYRQAGLPAQPEFPEGGRKLRNPVIVGAGPAGLAAAWYLAQCGCAPLVLERGRDVAARTADAAEFLKTRVLDETSNFLSGAGGAGTFSDGKLYTRIHDRRTDYVIAMLLAAGAPEEIAYVKRPHLGSDLLKAVVANLQRLIENAGGSFRYECTVKNLWIEHGRCAGVETLAGEKIPAPAVIFAHGLGGRELTLNLLPMLDFQLKGFQIGCRVEHEQEWVDFRQYRTSPRPGALGAAEYHLAMRSRSEIAGSGVATVCMCPGGEIVPATTWTGQLSSNGMSLRARSGRFANAAVITTIPADSFASPRDAYDFLAALEKRCFAAGGGDYGFPAQSVEGFLRRRADRRPPEASPATGVRPAELHALLPTEIARRFADAFRYFEHLMTGFRRGNVIGIESCVSSPVRFVRREASMFSNVPGVITAGEGAGYAGGIVSAAVDGWKAAEALLQTEG